MITSAASGDAQNDSELKRGRARCERKLGQGAGVSHAVSHNASRSPRPFASHNTSRLPPAPVWFFGRVGLDQEGGPAHYLCCFPVAPTPGEGRQVTGVVQAPRTSGWPPGLRPLFHRSQTSLFNGDFWLLIKSKTKAGLGFPTYVN